jgi:mannitol/fructose-specific phosphotransferase system IIA component (Ntr-type)
MAIALTDLLNPKHIDLDLRTRAPETALRKIVGLLAADGQINEPEKFLERVLDRERKNPSAVEHGVTFPHARTDLVTKIVLGIGRGRAGIPFGTGRARLIFLIGVPQRLVNDYLVCVGALARVLKDDVARNRLLGAKTPEEFITILSETSEQPFGSAS